MIQNVPECIKRPGTYFENKSAAFFICACGHFTLCPLRLVTFRFALLCIFLFSNTDILNSPEIPSGELYYLLFFRIVFCFIGFHIRFFLGFQLLYLLRCKLLRSGIVHLLYLRRIVMLRSGEGYYLAVA